MTSHINFHGRPACSALVDVDAPLRETMTEGAIHVYEPRWIGPKNLESDENWIDDGDDVDIIALVFPCRL